MQGINMEKIRLSKYFTDCGIMSRRAADAAIEQGLVTVNGRVAALGDKIEPSVDEVVYRGEKIEPQSTSRVCIMLNKPRGIVCTASDEKGRANVTELCRGVKDKNGAPLRIYPIGRLDMDSDGLLLLTNDGELANKLTHPRHSIPKIYHVTLKGSFDADMLRKLGSPIEIDGKITMRVNVTKVEETDGATVARFELYEGRNRQIRHMCEYHGIKILRLSRVAIGMLTLGNLEPGKWRYLDEKELHYLKTV